MSYLKMRLPVLVLFLIFLSSITNPAGSVATTQISKGFTATPDTSSTLFQPLLSDPIGVFSFGFFRIHSDHLDLVVIHLPSSFPVWRAGTGFQARWDGSTTLSFNGTLTLSDTKTGLLWSTGASSVGDKLVLLNSSNLQLQRVSQTEPMSVLWQSFDFPSDTIVQDQNFTSTASLISTNQLYSLKIGTNYLGLYMGISNASPMYWKHTALEAKAQIVEGKGPIYARVDTLGFLGVYQNEELPVDVIPFDTFNIPIPRFRRLTLEHDGNLKSYYWNNASWITEFTAITEACALPCGPYGLCHATEAGQVCGCLDNSTESCLPVDSNDLCGTDYWVLRRTGVELANKEITPFVKLGSMDECEKSCEVNCSCWGAVYNNVSGFCYRMDYPVEMAMAVQGEGKVGYFKVRKAMEGHRNNRMKVAVALLVIGAVIFAGGAGFGAYRVWKRRKGIEGSMLEGLSAGQYKDLSCSSFGSIELSNSFRK